MSDKLCPNCKAEMQKKETPVRTGFGQYNVVDSVVSYVCPYCRKVIVEVLML